MMQDEVEIWERFIKNNPGFFITCDYDFRVGDGVALDEDWEDNIKRMATMISQKRIDVLGWVGESPTIVELKRRVGLNTLGQILGYKTLFIKDFPNIKIPELLVIAESIDEDNILVMDSFKIPVVII